MLHTAHGPNLAHCHFAGGVYEVDDDTAKVWIAGGYAVAAPATTSKPAAPALETAAMDAGQKAAETGSAFKKLTGKGAGKGPGKGARGGNPQKTQAAEPAATEPVQAADDDSSADDSAGE